MPQTSRSSIYAKRVGLSIRAARQSAGMTQASVARRMGVSAPYIVAVEAGRANLTVGQLAAFAEAMQVGLEISFPEVASAYSEQSRAAVRRGRHRDIQSPEGRVVRKEASAMSAVTPVLALPRLGCGMPDQMPVVLLARPPSMAVTTAGAPLARFSSTAAPPRSRPR